MNIDIDVTDLTKLLKVQSELTRILRIVDYAVLQHKAAGSNGHPGFPFVEQGHGDIAPGNTLLGDKFETVVKGLPNRFTTTTVMVGMGDLAKLNRGAIRSSLTKLQEDGKIRLVEPGRGRKPSIFEKVS